jgi:electron transfer flavoprotein alpha subunit
MRRWSKLTWLIACSGVQMATLVVAEHSTGQLSKGTISAIRAAGNLGSDVHVLVAGTGMQAIAEDARRAAGVSKVHVADSPALQTWLAEPVSALLHALLKRCASAPGSGCTASTSV